MSDSQRAGRAILAAYIALTLLVSVGVVAMYVAHRGSDRLPAQVTRVALTGGLCYALYRGSRAAKWVSVALFAVGGAMALPGVTSDDPAAAALMGGMAALYSSFAAVLIGSRSVNDFLARQRGVDPTGQ